MVRPYTSVPVPQALDLAIKPGRVDDSFSTPYAYLLITRIPGLTLSQCQEVLSGCDYETISGQMKQLIAQLRAIPKFTDPNMACMAICNTPGLACQDPRVRGGEPVEPFADEVAFKSNAWLRRRPSSP